MNNDTCSLLGNEALLKREKVGFLASRRVPPEAVMRCLDWATRMRDEGTCVMSGFQSPLEREVLDEPGRRPDRARHGAERRVVPDDPCGRQGDPDGHGRRRPRVLRGRP